MPGIIDSAPDCVTTVNGALPADDSADFIIQAAYENCAGIMTFGPGTVYGEDGAGAATSYYVLTWIGIIVMVAVLDNLVKGAAGSAVQNLNIMLGIDERTGLL